MKQLTIPYIMYAIFEYPDGKKEHVRLGQYESFMITEENGFSVHATRTLIVPTKYVTNVTRSDGVKIHFDEPWYLQNDPI